MSCIFPVQVTFAIRNPLWYFISPRTPPLTTCRISVTFCKQLMRQIAVQNARKYLHKVAKSYAYSPRDIPHSTFAFVPLTFPVKLLTFSVIKMRKLLDSCCTTAESCEGAQCDKTNISRGCPTNDRWYKKKQL